MFVIWGGGGGGLVCLFCHSSERCLQTTTTLGEAASSQYTPASAPILFTSFCGMGITPSPRYRPKQSAALVGAGCGAAASIGIAAVSG